MKQTPKVLLVTAVMCSCAVVALASQHPTTISARHPQTTWAPIGRQPLADHQAALFVTHRPEDRFDNVADNDYVPTLAQLNAFRNARNANGQTAVQENPWNAYVTGRPHLHNPSTDDLIQWAAHKWGIPEDWMRAQLVWESWWHMNWSGDKAAVSPSWYQKYPTQFHLSDWQVWQSIGVAQIKWTPNGAIGVGTEPLRWKSTAFDVDYMGATIRYYYDGKCKWCGKGYHAGEKWLSIAAWNRPKPWGNSRARWYLRQVQNILNQRFWEQPSFAKGMPIVGKYNKDR